MDAPLLQNFDQHPLPLYTPIPDTTTNTITLPPIQQDPSRITTPLLGNELELEDLDQLHSLQTAPIPHFEQPSLQPQTLNQALKDISLHLETQINNTNVEISTQLDLSAQYTTPHQVNDYLSNLQKHLRSTPPDHPDYQDLQRQLCHTKYLQELHLHLSPQQVKDTIQEHIQTLAEEKLSLIHKKNALTYLTQLHDCPPQSLPHLDQETYLWLKQKLPTQLPQHLQNHQTLNPILQTLQPFSQQETIHFQQEKKQHILLNVIAPHDDLWKTYHRRQSTSEPNFTPQSPHDALFESARQLSLQADSLRDAFVPSKSAKRTTKRAVYFWIKDLLDAAKDAKKAALKPSATIGDEEDFQTAKNRLAEVRKLYRLHNQGKTPQQIKDLMQQNLSSRLQNAFKLYDQADALRLLAATSLLNSDPSSPLHPDIKLWLQEHLSQFIPPEFQNEQFLQQLLHKIHHFPTMKPDACQQLAQKRERVQQNLISKYDSIWNSFYHKQTDKKTEFLAYYFDVPPY